jgi:hypothetical protein
MSNELNFDVDRYWYEDYDAKEYSNVLISRGALSAGIAATMLVGACIMTLTMISSVDGTEKESQKGSL